MRILFIDQAPMTKDKGPACHVAHITKWLNSYANAF
jgi:hypothetical protein